MLSRLTSAAMGTAPNRSARPISATTKTGRRGKAVDPDAGRQAQEQKRRRLGGAEYPELQWTVLEDEDGGQRKCKQGDFGAEQRDRLAAMRRRYVQSR